MSEEYVARDTLILSSNFPPVEGGIAHFIYQITSKLPSGRVSVIALPTNGYQDIDAGLIFPIKRLTIPAKWKSSSSAFKLLAPLYFLGARNMKDVRYVVCDRAHHTLLLAAHWLRKKGNARVITFVHGTDVGRHQNKWYARYFNNLLKSVDTVIANSSVTAEMVAALGVDPSIIHVINPPIDPDEYRIRMEPQMVRRKFSVIGCKIILSLGRLVERKGFDTLIKAMPEVVRVVPDAHCIIAGTGPDYPRLESLVRDHGMEKYVTFIGYVRDQDLPDVYNSADVFAMVSRELKDKGDTEGFGIVYLEANLLGKPVVAGRSGGVVDAVEDGVSGVLVDPGNVFEVSHALITLLKNSDRAMEMGLAGRQRVLNRFTSRDAAERFLKILASIDGAP